MTTEPSIFTRIINREIPASIVYEDDLTIAFLTIEPITKGHTLVVPKKPFTNVLDGDETSLAAMMVVAKKVGNALISAGFGDGVNLIMNCGEAADQEVTHAHLHVVPRHKDDHALVKPNHISYQDTESSSVADAIKAYL